MPGYEPCGTIWKHRLPQKTCCLGKDRADEQSWQTWRKITLTISRLREKELISGTVDGLRKRKGKFTGNGGRIESCERGHWTALLKTWDNKKSGKITGRQEWKGCGWLRKLLRRSGSDLHSTCRRLIVTTADFSCPPDEWFSSYSVSTIKSLTGWVNQISLRVKIPHATLIKSVLLEDVRISKISADSSDVWRRWRWRCWNDKVNAGDNLGFHAIKFSIVIPKGSIMQPWLRSTAHGYL